MRQDTHNHAPMRRRLMGVRLMVEVLDHAPPDLAPADRLLLVAIAESANDQTRQGWPGLELLAHRTGLKPESVSQALRRLAKRGLEVRVPIGVGKDGRPVYSYEGHRTTYRIPPLTQRPDRGRPSEPLPSSGLSTSEALPESPEALPRSGRGPTTVGPFSSMNPQDPSSLSGHERVVMEALAPAGVTEDEMREVIKEIRQATKGKIENPIGYFRRIAERGDLPDYLNRVRANAERRAAYAARQAQPPPVVPEQAPAPDEPSATPEEREAAIAATREALQGLRTRKDERGKKGIAKVLRAPAAPPEVPPAVQAARDYLNTRGDFSHWMTAARDKLGSDAARDDVVVLAAELAKESEALAR